MTDLLLGHGLDPLPVPDEVENQARQKSLTVLFQELAGMLPGLPEALSQPVPLLPELVSPVPAWPAVP